VDHRRLVLCPTEQIVYGLSFRGYRQDMEVNGYKIEPGANREGANLEGVKLKGATMFDGRIHD